eukprot:m.20676 g.20676  ORF g.20676 m.20676 type:complete len:189 (+) comp6229_c0_seq1:71-637(+)
MAKPPPCFYTPGDKAVVIDFVKKWYVSTIVRVDEEGNRLFIHYDGWQPRYDTWIMMPDEDDIYKLILPEDCPGERQTRDPASRPGYEPTNTADHWNERRIEVFPEGADPFPRVHNATTTAPEDVDAAEASRVGLTTLLKFVDQGAAKRRVVKPARGFYDAEDDTDTEDEIDHLADDLGDGLGLGGPLA